MRIECFEFKRCCCCIPLRYGLLIIGYLKLAVTALLFASIVHELILFEQRQRASSNTVYQFQWMIFAAIIVVLLSDMALGIVFVIGGHKKDPKLLKVYNYYSLGLLVLLVIAYIIIHGMQFYILALRYGILFSFYILSTSLAVGFIDICFQAYIILLTKSEIAKLENNSMMRYFVNNAAEAECRMSQGQDESSETYIKSDPGNGITGTDVISIEPGKDNSGTVKNSELADHYDVNENEVNGLRDSKKNGNYVRLS